MSMALLQSENLNNGSDITASTRSENLHAQYTPIPYGLSEIMTMTMMTPIDDDYEDHDHNS